MLRWEGLGWLSPPRAWLAPGVSVPSKPPQVWLAPIARGFCPRVGVSFSGGLSAKALAFPNQSAPSFICSWRSAQPSSSIKSCVFGGNCEIVVESDQLRLILRRRGGVATGNWDRTGGRLRDTGSLSGTGAAGLLLEAAMELSQKGYGNGDYPRTPRPHHRRALKRGRSSTAGGLEPPIRHSGALPRVHSRTTLPPPSGPARYWLRRHESGIPRTPYHPKIRPDRLQASTK